VWVAQTDKPRETERRLLRQFEEDYGKLPFANRRR
jgi:hypothetical protein